MAWNGRNVSILGAKPAVNNDVPAAGAPSSSKAGNTTSSPNNQAEAAVDAKKSAPATLASTQKSVWGGKHSKIMAIRDNSKDAPANNESSSAVASSNNIAPSPPLAISSTRSKDLKKEPIKMQKVVSSSPKDIKPVVGQQQPMAKEDETTNSTAGSSTTNTTITDHEDPAATLEVKVVTTTTVSLDSGKKNDSSSSQEKNAASSSSNAAPTTTVRSGKNNNTSNGGANANAAAARRSGNNKGGRANNNNNSGNNNSGNNNGRQNYSRGGGSGGSARRRVNNNGEKQVCSFFLRGMCNRGTSCAFKHEGPAHAPTDSEPSSSNPPIRKSPSNGSNQSMKATATTFVPSKRTFDPNKARAIQLAKEAQDQEDRSKYASSVKIIPGAEEDKKDDEEEQVEEEPAFFSIDVECIATGYGSCAKGINDGCGNEGRNKEGIPSGQYNDRSHRYPGRVAMVDSDGNVLTDMIIRPPKDGAGVVSYLAPLTGLTSEMCFGSDAKSLEEAVEIIKGLLPKNGVLVGQAIDHDVEWLGLTPGKDFERMVDISEIFRQRMPAVLGQAAEVLKAKKEEESKDEEEQTSSASDDLSSDEHLGFATRYRHFSLRHVCLNLLGTDIQSGVHDPITDAKYSLTLFHKYRNSSVTQLRIVRDGLHRAPITPGFAAENTPVIDGVCVSAAGYRYKFAARKIWNWFTAKKQESC